MNKSKNFSESYESNRSIEKNALKTVIVFSFFGIAFLHLFSSLPGLYSSIRSLQNAKRISLLNDISDNLFTAVGNYGFERGRVNVVLNDVGPVSGMEANRQFIQKRRQEGEDALSQALDTLSGAALSKVSQKIIRVKALHENLRELRSKADHNMVIEHTIRDKGFAQTWFAAMTQYIESIEALLVSISIDISNSDGVISRYSSLKHETLALRNTSGPEMSILSATMRSGKPIKQELYNKIQKLHTITTHHFQNIEFLCQGFSNATIPEALNKLKESYYGDYVPYRNQIFPFTKAGGPYPYSQEKFLMHGVDALKEIAGFMDVLISETKGYANFNINRNWQQILFLGISSAGSLLALIVIFIYTNKKIISPISRLTSTLRKLSLKQTNVDVPFITQKNEIGKMARALAVFQESLIRLDEDNLLLKVAEEKVRISEEKLKTILNSIPDMIVECDKDFTILWGNKTALEFNSDIIGQPCYKAFRGNNKTCADCYCQKALETGEIQAGIVQLTESKNGKASYWELLGIPIENSNKSDKTVLEVSRNVTKRVNAENEKEKLIDELKKALAEVKTLSGLLPICSHCKKIRDDKGYWNSLEQYLQEHSDATLSHGICEDCLKQHYPKYADTIIKKRTI